MKRVCQIAKDCNVEWETIDGIIRKENIIKCGFFVKKNDEEKIHRILYFEGKITEITLESKMNYE